jgi:NAD-dependent dihydropyrimidine dehydrogenase PreA subunit
MRAEHPEARPRAVTVQQSGEPVMTYVITQPCIGEKDASCVDVCPVDCIHPTQGEPDFETVELLYINPDECIDCGACEPACPFTAIFEESAVPAQWKDFIQLNADYFKGK